MSKKDYVLIADAIKPFLRQFSGLPEHHDSQSRLVPIDQVVRAIVIALGYDNARFDESRFMAYLAK